MAWLTESAPDANDGEFQSPAGEFSTLTENADGTYSRDLIDGTAIRFDTVGRQTSRIGRNGDTTNYAYDAEQRLTAITDPAGRETILSYADGLLSTITDPAGRITRLRHDARGDLTEVTDPDGTVRGFGYDANHRMTAQISKRGFSTEYEYNFAGRHVLSRLPDGSTRSILPSGMTGLADPSSGAGTRDNPAAVVRAMEARARVTDGAGRTTTLATNQLGQATEIVDAAGLVTEIDRNAAGSPTRIHLPSGHEFVQTYDDKGQMLSSRDAVLGGTWTYAYSSDFGQITSVTDANGHTLSMTYDAAGNPTEFSSELGRSGSVGYTDEEGLPSALTDPQGVRWSFEYDAKGNVVRIAAGEGAEQRVITFGYDQAGEISSAVDPLGRAIAFERDPLGRLTSFRRRDDAVTAYDYDAAGNLSRVTPPGRPPHTFTYTALDQLASYEPPPVGGVSNRANFRYDAAQKLVQFTRADGQDVDFSFDDAGRLAALQIPRGALTYAYDPDTGNLASIGAPQGITTSYDYIAALLLAETWAGPIEGRVSRSYRADYRLHEIQVNSESAIGFDYDADGQLTRAGAFSLIRDTESGIVAAATLERVADSWTENDFGEFASHTVAHDGETIFAVAYTRDKLGRIVTETETVDATTRAFTYEYDLVGRLVEVKRDGVTSATYSYDANGNRIGVTDAAGPISAEYDDQDRLVRYNDTTFQYAPDGELLSRTVDDQSTIYRYDALGDLVAVTLADGTEIDYLVDGRNRRIGRKTNGALDYGLLYQDGLNPIAVLAANGDVLSRFVYASKPHVPDYMIKGGDLYRIVTDARGSPRLVVDADTGAIAQRIDYDAFGDVLVDTNPGFQPFGFAGGLYDRDTGLVRFGARDYDPAVGRWTTQDPIGFEGTDTNLYLYAANDPVNRIDPNGERDVDVSKIFRTAGAQGTLWAVRGNFAYGPVGLVCGAIFGTGLGLVQGSVFELIGIDLVALAGRAANGLWDMTVGAWDRVGAAKDFALALPGRSKRKLVRLFTEIVEQEEEELDKFLLSCKRSDYCPIPPNPVVFELPP